LSVLPLAYFLVKREACQRETEETQKT
jgi:hypothetical protein